MTTPINGPTSNAPSLASSPSSVNAPTPVGVGSSPSSLSSTDPSPPNPWETVIGYCETFAQFIRRLIIEAIRGLHIGLGFVIDLFGGNSKSAEPFTPDPQWELPKEIQLEPVAVRENRQNNPDPFSTCPITDIDRQKIYTIITAMTGTYFSMLIRKGEIEQLGTEIADVHPLKFIEYIFKHPTLPQHMETISKDKLTWTPFVKGFSEKMIRMQATLAPLKAGFARSMNVDPKDLEPHFASSTWKEMLLFLIEVKTGRKASVWVEAAPLPVLAVPQPVIAPLPSFSPALLQSPSQPVFRLADLPFSSEDEKNLANILKGYSSKGRCVLPPRSFTSSWKKLENCHPFKILSYLYAQPALISELDSIFSYKYTTKRFFIQEFTSALSKLEQSYIIPYVEEFSKSCHLDAKRVVQQIEKKKWDQLIEDLKVSHEKNFHVTIIT